MIDPLNIPIYITTRDRISDLKLLVDWLEKAGQQRIIFLDNQSTYVPLVEYLENTPHEVIFLPYNQGSRALWMTNLWLHQDFVLTDPDVVPIAECPPDLVAHLQELSMRHLAHPKIGVGLYLDDVPQDLPSLTWERDLVNPARQIAPGVFDSLVDTTFAFHTAGTPFRYESLRTGAPYQARHMPWYRRLPLDEEHAYYYARMNTGFDASSWTPLPQEEADEIDTQPEEG